MKRLLLITILTLITALSGAAAADADYTQPESLKELLENGTGDYLFLDVRTRGEYDAGHIPGARLIPHYELPGALPEGTEKDDLIIVYCRSGNRSGQGARALKAAGYTNVQDFGGIRRWPYDLE